MRRTLVTLALCSACAKLNEEGMGTDESSSSSTSDNPNPSVGTTVTTSDPSDDPTTGSTDDGSDTDTDVDPSSSSDDGSSSESSTGEPSTDFALFFDGDATASATQPYGWQASDFNVEVWIEIRDADTCQGIILDARNDSRTAGWSLYFEPGTQQLYFAFIGDEGDWNYVEGPQVGEIGVGWHHIAASKSESTLFLFVDGISQDAGSVNPSLAIPLISKFRLGYHPAEGDEWRLTDASIDDVLVVDYAKYMANFSPMSVYDDDSEKRILRLELDENEGVVATDPGGKTFALEGTEWTAGHE